MGEDKAAIEIAGVPLLERVGGTLHSVVGRVVVLGPPRQGYETWPDEVPVTGPLAGLATALTRMSEDRLLLVAVDNAFAQAATLTRLVSIESDLPVVPVDERGVRQVTCAVYPGHLMGAAVEEAESGGSIQTLLDRVSFLPITPEEWREWGEDGRSWYSVDTPDALAEGIHRFG